VNAIVVVNTWDLPAPPQIRRMRRHRLQCRPRLTMMHCPAGTTASVAAARCLATCRAEIGNQHQGRPPMSALFLLSILLCLIAGAAIDTSNICLVRGTDALARGRPAIALGILLATACASVIFALNTEFGLHHRPAGWAHPSWITVAGAALFACGAMLNGACAVGTIGRLARGDIGHLATFAGAFAVAWYVPRAKIEYYPMTMPIVSGPTWVLIILVGTIVTLALGYRHLRGARLGSFVILGVTAALVTDWQGNWTWLALFQQLHADLPLPYTIFACIAAVVAGAAVVARLAGRFRLVRPNPQMMLREFVGGGMMLGGAILIPGANDALAAYGVPSGSPHAVVGYLVMFALMVIVFRLRFVFDSWNLRAGPRTLA
jgi:hypothetical protein